MTPRTLVTAIAAAFVGSLVTALVMGVVQKGSLNINGVAMGLVFFGMALGLGRGLVRGCPIDRWLTALISGSLVAGVCVNSSPRPAAGLVMLGLAFLFCAVGLLTPYAGRHFAAEIPNERDRAG